MIQECFHSNLYFLLNTSLRYIVTAEIAGLLNQNYFHWLTECLVTFQLIGVLYMNILTYQLQSEVSSLVTQNVSWSPALCLPCSMILLWMPNKYWPIHCSKRTRTVFVKAWNRVHSWSPSPKGLVGPTRFWCNESKFLKLGPRRWWF